MKTYTLRLLKLGDTWAAVSWLLQQRQARLTEYTRGRTGPFCVKPLVHEIQALLKTDEKVEFAEGNRGGHFPGEERYQHTYLPTAIPWNDSGDRIICTQLDGRYKARLKNCSPADNERLLTRLATAGFDVRPVGLPLTLEESVRLLCKCFCFIGVDSGMMHVANSVRCPRILIRNRMVGLDSIYTGKAMITVRDAGEALRLFV